MSAAFATRCSVAYKAQPELEEFCARLIIDHDLQTPPVVHLAWPALDEVLLPAHRLRTRLVFIGQQLAMVVSAQ